MVNFNMNCNFETNFYVNPEEKKKGYMCLEKENK